MSTNPWRIAKRLAQVKPSVTMAVTAKATEMRAAGRDVISFGAGEPDFETPSYIVSAVREALDAGVSKYTNVAGLIELRTAVASELSEVHNVELAPEQILVSCGAKHSLFNVCMALLDPGDEVIVCAPYWVSYPEMVRLAGATPVVVSASGEDNYMIAPDALEAAITDKTRAIIFNNPSNPTGAVYTAERLEAIAEICDRRGLLVLSDDIYRQLVYAGAEYHSMARIRPSLADRVIFVDGVSKTYAMTGWRIGFTAGPQSLIKAMAKIQGQSTSGAARVSQVAALAAITGDRGDSISTMHTTFDSRRKRMVELLRAIPGMTCAEPRGAFYAFPDASAFIGEGKIAADDVALATSLVETAGVAVVPGSGFGAPGCLRLSYACSMEDIETGVARLAEALS